MRRRHWDQQQLPKRNDPLGYGYTVIDFTAKLLNEQTEYKLCIEINQIFFPPQHLTEPELYYVEQSNLMSQYNYDLSIII